MQTEKKRKFIIDFVYLLLIGLLIYFVFKYAIGFLMPFIIAYAVAALLQRFVKLAENKLKFSHKVASLVTVIIFYCTIGALVICICIGIFYYIKDQIVKIPQIYKNTIEPAASLLLENIDKLTDNMNPTFAAAIDNIASNLFTYLANIVTTLSGAVVSLVSSVATSLPTLALKVVFALIASFYFTSDYDKIHDFIEHQCTDHVWSKIKATRIAIGQIIFSYVKSYAIILGITFLELAVAMLVLGVNNFATVAFMIAIFDILPVVGTGTILIPWTVIELIRGNYTMAIGLIIAYVVIFIVRQVIEPKIVGEHVGLHPLVTLLAMFVGSILFGIIGLFGIPITIAILVDLNEKGVINLFKH